MIYLPGLVLLGSFLLALTLLLRGLRRTAEHTGERLSRQRSNLLRWIFASVCALAVYLMASSMFGHFHAVGVDPLHVELDYLWPQPSLILDRSEVVDLRLVRGARTCGHLELLTRHAIHVSVNFKSCDNANILLKELPIGAR